jgi:hypothetical protein
MSPSFRRMKCCVPKGRAIVLSGFYGETESSCIFDDGWGLSSHDSERLVAQIGDNNLPTLSDRSLSLLENMIRKHMRSTYEELQKCVLNMVPTRRQLLLVFRTTMLDHDYDVDQLNKLYWEVTRVTKRNNNEVSRST